VKIQNDITKDRKDPLAMVYQDEKVHACLKDLGIDIGRHAHPDFVFTMANGLKEVKPNTIAFERIDGCQVKNKKLLKDKNLLKLVKMYKYADWDLTNQDCVDGRIFTRFLTDDIKPEKVHIDEDDFKKVTLGASFLHYKRHDLVECIVKELDWGKPKNDVFFAGTVQGYAKNGHASGKLISQHRKGCIDLINSLKGKSIKTGQNIGKARAFGARDYLLNIADAKVTVSPWGWGESCYRDYEALMLGTDVIKPRSYTILSNPDIYSGDVFYCKPDWSDLESTIEMCLDTWDSRVNERLEASKKLIKIRQPEAIASIIEKIIKEV
jgi:hypothetical protein